MSLIKRVRAGLLASIMAVTAVPAVGISAAAGTKITVGKGEGFDFATVSEAVASVGNAPASIIINEGIYNEDVVIDKPNVRLVGNGNSENIVITYDKANGHADKSKNFGTGKTATVLVTENANGFSATGLTFQNSYSLGENAPYAQAVAFESKADKVVLENCRFIGRQDTLYLTGASKGQRTPGANTVRTYVKNCYIEGTYDFIFGDGTAFFDSCDINMCYYAKGGHYTAANTTLSNIGYVFSGCHFKTDPLITASVKEQFDLGRPWQADEDYPCSGSQTVLVNCTLSKNIADKGFSLWNEKTEQNKIRYYEYNSKYENGDLVDVSKRANYVKQLTAEQAALYNPLNILGGTDGWNPANAEGERGVCDITLDKSKVSVPVGEKTVLKGCLLPKQHTTGITFTSSNEEIAKVDQNGTVKGIKMGTVLISATTDNGMSTFAVVNVTAERTAIPVIKEAKMNASSNLLVGKTVTLTYSYKLKEDNVNDAAKIRWYAVKGDEYYILQEGVGEAFKSYELKSEDAGFTIYADIYPAATTTYGQYGTPYTCSTQTEVKPNGDEKCLLREKAFSEDNWNRVGDFVRVTEDNNSFLTADSTKQNAVLSYKYGTDFNNNTIFGRFRFEPSLKGFNDGGSFSEYLNFNDKGYYRLEITKGGNTKSAVVNLYKRENKQQEVLLISDSTSLKNNFTQSSGENNPYFYITFSKDGERITAQIRLEGETKNLASLSYKDVAPLGEGTVAFCWEGCKPVLLIDSICITSNNISDEGKQRIFLMGDSTVKHYGNDNTIGGWGEYLVNFFDDDIKIINKAEGGRSSRSYINQGRLDEVVSMLRPGDYVFIQFGTNDQRTDENAFAEHSVILGTPDENGKYPETPARKVATPQNIIDVYKNTEYPYKDTYYPYESGNFKWYLKQYIPAVKQKGAIPVIFTPACRIFFDSEGKIENHFGENNGYVLSALQLAEEENVLCVDLYDLTKSLYESYGIMTTQGLHNIKEDGSVDITHYNKFGANLVASKIAATIKDMNIKGISEHVTESIKLVTKTDSLKTADLIIVGGRGAAATVGDFAVDSAGFGDYFANFLSDKITVKNLAVAGETALSFKDTEQYRQYISNLDEGDYVFIAFGADDAKDSALGNENTNGSYAYNLYNYYVKPALDANAVPILFTPLTQRKVNGEELALTDNPYTQATVDLVTSKSLFFVNLDNITRELYTNMGAEGGKVLLAYDRKNGICSGEFSKFGAKTVAKQILNACKYSSASLKDYINDSELNQNAPMSRGDYVYMLMDVINSNVYPYTNFGDCARGQYYTDHIGVAKSLGIVTAAQGNKFMPESKVTSEFLKKTTDLAIATTGKQIDMTEVYDIVKGNNISPETGIWVIDKLYEALNK